MRTTEKEKAFVYARLSRLGFTPDESRTLRRISLTLHRWHELECGGDHGYIERDEKTGRAYWVSQFGARWGMNARARRPIADRETGARERLRAIMARHNHRHLFAYIQTDPRGAALYIGKRSSLKRYGGDIESCYSSAGVAVY